MKVFIFVWIAIFYCKNGEKEGLFEMVCVQYQNDNEMTSIRFQGAKRGNFIIISTMGPNIELPYVCHL